MGGGGVAATIARRTTFLAVQRADGEVLPNGDEAGRDAAPVPGPPGEEQHRHSLPGCEGWGSCPPFCTIPTIAFNKRKLDSPVKGAPYVWLFKRAQWSMYRNNLTRYSTLLVSRNYVSTF
jgi:hypothetical protein